MKFCLAYIRRFFIFCMAFFGADCSYSGDYINGHEHDYLDQVFIDAREDDHKEMMSHYKLMIKKVEDSSDTDARDILLKEARALECAYENQKVFDPLSRTLQYIYSSSINEYIYTGLKMKRARKYIKEFETYVNEIDKLKGAELLSYMRRSGFLVILKRCRPEFFNDESLTMLDEYDILIREVFNTVDRSSSQAVAKYERFTYLNEEEMPKLILSLRDSMKEELLERHRTIHQIDEEQRKIRKRISPYLEVSAILMQLESDYDDMCEEYKRRYESSASEIESSSIQKKL